MLACRMIIVGFALFAMTAAPMARSMEWVSDRDIASFCSQFLVRPKTPSGTVCLSYIQGYLDGLRTTEVPASHEMEFHVDDADEKQALHVSAVRLDALVEEFGPAARAGICLPEDFSEEELVRVIARELRHGRSYTRAALDDYAQAALRERYPCNISDPEAAHEQPDAEPLPDSRNDRMLDGGQDIRFDAGDNGEADDRAQDDETSDETSDETGDRN